MEIGNPIAAPAAWWDRITGIKPQGGVAVAAFGGGVNSLFIYTCPASKKAWIQGIHFSAQRTVIGGTEGNIDFNVKITPSGGALQTNKYGFGKIGNVAGNYAVTDAALFLLLSPGDVLEVVAINNDTVSGTVTVNVQCAANEFSA